VTDGAAATPPHARSTRASSEQRIRLFTRTACALLTALIATLAYTAAGSHHTDGTHATRP